MASSKHAPVRGRPLECFLDAVRQERIRQDKKWGIGSQRDPRQFLAILVEEVGEVAKELAEGRPRCAALQEELIQVAAVCAKWAEWGFVGLDDQETGYGG